MSNTKHTPGPWIISPASTNTAAWDEIYSSDMSQAICSMDMLKQKYIYPVPEGEGYLEDSDEIDQAIANTKLIAAAPAMYEFIENVAIGQQGELKGDFISRIQSEAKELIKKINP